jgi:molecular chaperone HscB
MSSIDLQQNYFELFRLPVQFELDQGRLGESFRQLQRELHPDRFASASPHEQRVAVQYSAYVNQAFATLRHPLPRALYLLQLAGVDQDAVSDTQVSGGFLMEQMELREKLESIPSRVDPEAALDHLVAEITADNTMHEQEFAVAYGAGDLAAAASACVKMQYLGKLLDETEQLESTFLED